MSETFWSTFFILGGILVMLAEILLYAWFSRLAAFWLFGIRLHYKRCVKSSFIISICNGIICAVALAFLVGLAALFSEDSGSSLANSKGSLSIGAIFAAFSGLIVFISTTWMQDRMLLCPAERSGDFESAPPGNMKRSTGTIILYSMTASGLSFITLYIFMLAFPVSFLPLIYLISSLSAG